MHVREMIDSHPDVGGRSADALFRCIERCWDCAQACNSCADACLAEDKLEALRQCIRLDLDCADLCAATARIASRRTGSNIEVLHGLISLCAEACRTCADECAKHAEMHEHCRICAEICKSCEGACLQALPLIH